MKHSIITVNLNNASGLSKTVESVISQTSRDFEYIIIDGGSTDGSVEVIQSFTNIPPNTYIPLTNTPNFEHHAPCPITYWTSEPDQGIYHAMNKGIRATKGEFCQFLNSGDWLASNEVIERMLSTLPDCSIYYGNMLKQLANGKILRDSCKKGNLTMFSFYRGSLNHSPAFIKRSLFEKYGLYDESLKIASDWKWYLISIILHNEPVQYVDLDVTCFDMKGISNTNTNLDKTERLKVLEELIPLKILADYDAQWLNIERANRINEYKITRWAFGLIERALFKWEKLLQKRLLINANP